MTNLSKFMADNRRRMDQANADLLASARAAILALKDAGRVHAAKDMEEKVFMIDSITGEIGDYMKNNMDSVMADMKVMIGRMGKNEPED